MKRFALLAFAFALLAACETPPTAPTPLSPTATAPSFAQLFNDKVDVSGTFLSSCPPTEPVAFQGSIHVHATGEISPTRTDIKFHANAQGIEGVGLTSGDRYNVPQNTKDDLEFSSPPPRIEEEFDLRFRLIRQGSDDNFWLRFKFRFSFPPFEFELIKLEIECRG
jgi:hypothetical protein